MSTLPDHRTMRGAFLAGDPGFDGVFFAGVRTTGIFCRPSCTARKPRPEHLEFFATAGAALEAGYRACKRCRPLDAEGRPPPWVTRLLGRLEAVPGERIRAADLRAAGIDPARARRWFQRHYGMTFRAYERARRLAGALGQIKGGSSVSEVAGESGFESESGFREAFVRTFGAAPVAAAARDAVRLEWIASPAGPLLAGATDAGLCLLEFTDRHVLEEQLGTLRRRLQAPLVPGGHRWLDALRGQLEEYFDGRRQRFELSLVMRGTPFQEQVWRALLEIPYAETRSYRDIAARIGHPGATRAVGTANGMNRISIVIPCHRVVTADGRLGGYGGGPWRKQFLLDLERGQRRLDGPGVGRAAAPPARAARRDVPGRPAGRGAT